MPNVEHEGRYRGKVTSWEVVEGEGDSRSVRISLRLDLYDFQVDGDFQTVANAPLHCFGDIYIVGKKGDVLVENTARAKTVLGWSGQYTQIGLLSVPPIVDVQAVVKRSEWNGNVRLRAEWFDPFEMEDKSSGGSKFAAPADRLAELDAMFGDQLKAIGGPPPKKKKAPKKTVVETPEDPPF